MYEIRTEIDIAASPSRVWDVLTDFPAHAQWNPFMRSVSGQAVPGRRLEVRLQPEDGRAMTFRPTVLVARPNEEFRWRGRVLMPGLFDGEHYFRIAPQSDGKTRLIHGECFTGLLVGLAKSSLDGGTRAGFVAMNQALKARAERN